MSSTSLFERVPCDKATSADIDPATMEWFASRASRAAHLPAASHLQTLLTHLELWSHDCPTNGAVLLFARKPQKFFKSATIRCTSTIPVNGKVSKPEIMKGTLFDLVDGALDFLESSTAPGFKVPRDVLLEAVVNAVSHRDYSSPRSIEINASSGQIEIWNPGEHPPALTIDALRRPHQSFPRNPRIAQCLFLARYTERIGTGTRDMIMTTRGVGLPVPQYSVRDNGFLVSFSAK
jgi:predicted HTH transcriptional regulator